MLSHKRIAKMHKRYLAKQTLESRDAWYKAMTRKYNTLPDNEKGCLLTLELIGDILKHQPINAKAVFCALDCLSEKLKHNNSGNFHSQCIAHNLPPLVTKSMLFLASAFRKQNQFESIVSIWKSWLKNKRMKRFATDEFFQSISGLHRNVCCDDGTKLRLAKIMALYPNMYLIWYHSEDNKEMLDFLEKKLNEPECAFDANVLIGRILKWSSNVYIAETLKERLVDLRTEIVEDGPTFFKVSCEHCEDNNAIYSCPCGFAHYCNRSHQKKNWSKHRFSCPCERVLTL